jgi:catechol 2,3-dioxygenase
VGQLEDSPTATSAPRTSIDPATRLGAVALTTSDLARSRAFYEQVMGLRASELGNGTVSMGVDGGPALINLYGDPSAAPLDRRRTGLFHLAILLPSRPDLALALARLAAANWPLDGASDHLVSEALYLSDPDGNGIEIYRDRPRQQWPRSGGRLQMATLPLDLRDLLGELPGGSDGAQPMPATTSIGHVHLQVSELLQSEQFYCGVLGFDVIVRGYPGALFLSAGGYHHHIGLNTWNSAGAARPVHGAVGLRSFEVVLPGTPQLEAVLENVWAANIETRPAGAATEIEDPSGNRLLLRADE